MPWDRFDATHLLARMGSGYAVMGDTQHLPGYCLLPSDMDGAYHRTDLPRAERVTLAAELARLLSG